VEASKKKPPFASPAMAYNAAPLAARAKSALAGVNVGPVSQVFELMSYRSVTLRLVPGEAGPQPPAT
jgi:hypothetical protein